MYYKTTNQYSYRIYPRGKNNDRYHGEFCILNPSTPAATILNPSTPAAIAAAIAFAAGPVLFDDFDCLAVEGPAGDCRRDPVDQVF